MDFLTEYVRPLSKLADFSIIIPAGVLLLRRRYIKGGKRLLVLFVLLTLGRNLVTEILSAYRIYNIIFYNWYAILAYLNIACLYHLLLKGPVRAYFIPGSCLLLIGLAMLDYETLFNARTTLFNAYAYPLSGVFVIVLVLTFFVQLLESLRVPDIKRYTFFWFSAGALLYYTGTLLMNLFSRYTLSVTETVNVQRQFWSIDCILTILFNCIMALGFWYIGYQQRSSEIEKPARSGVIL